MSRENTLVMELKTGPVTIALRPDLAPGSRRAGYRTREIGIL